MIEEVGMERTDAKRFRPTSYEGLKIYPVEDEGRTYWVAEDRFGVAAMAPTRAALIELIDEDQPQHR